MQEKQTENIVETTEKLIELQKSIDLLREVYGVAPVLPETMSERAMEKKLDEIRSDARYADAAELFTFNQLLYRRNSLQREAQFVPTGSQEEAEEFIVVNQTETYHEYMKSILEHILKTSDEYLVLRRGLPAIPLDILAKERELETYHTELAQLLQKRLDFSNASLASYLISVQRDRKGNVMQNQETLLAQLETLKKRMDAAGQAALGQQDRQAIRIHSSALDQRIIELIATKGQLPAEILLSLQTERYRLVLEQQKAIIRNQGSAKSNYAKISEERRGLSDRIVQTAEDLTEFHQRALELLILQKQFKSSDSPEGVGPPNPDDTPPLVREKIAEVTELRAQFHRERLTAFVGRFEEEVLSVGIPEKAEEFGNTTGREFVRNIGNRISSLITWPAPEALGVRDFIRGRLSGPLNDAMGWPVDKMDLEFKDLEPYEQKAVLDRSKSIADAIRAFDRKKIARVQNAMTVLQLLPPAKDALATKPKNPLPPLPAEGLTSHNKDQMIARHGLATVYMLAIREMDESMGDPSSGFIGEIKTFTNSVNDVIDVHVDVADALFKQKNDWLTLMYGILAGAAAGAAAMYLAPKALKAAAKKAGRFLRPTAAAEKVAEGSSKLTKLAKVGRVLGPIGIIATYADWVRVNRRDARLQKLSEAEGVAAAIEFMGKKGINKRDERYPAEMRYLHDRAEALRMQQNAITLVQQLRDDPDATALRNRCIEIEKFSRKQKEECEKLFPITDFLLTDPKGAEENIGFDVRYIHLARVRGMAYEKEKASKMPIDHSLLQSKKPPEKQPAGKPSAEALRMLRTMMSEHDESRTRDPEHNFEDLKEAHDRLLEDAADFLEK